SASEYTVTVLMPIRRQVLIILTAISPRLATSTDSIGGVIRARLSRGSPLGKTSSSHAENAKWSGRDLRVERGREAEAQHHSGVDRIDDTIVPQSGGREIRIPFRFISGKRRRRERLALRVRHVAPVAMEVVEPYLEEHACRLLTAHDADARVRP